MVLKFKGVDPKGVDPKAVDPKAVDQAQSELSVSDVASFEIVASANSDYPSAMFTETQDAQPIRSLGPHGLPTSVSPETAAGGVDPSVTIVESSKPLADLVRSELPSKKMDIIKRALQWSRSDDLLHGLLDTKTLFTMTGFTLSCKPVVGSDIDTLMGRLSTGNADKGAPTDKDDKDADDIPDEMIGAPGKDQESPLSEAEETAIPDELKKSVIEQVEFQRKLNLIKRKFELYDVVRQLLWDWYVTDSCVLYWQISDESIGGLSSSNDLPDDPNSRSNLIPGLNSIVVLDLLDVEWDNTFGRNMMKATIPKSIIDKINKAVGQTGTTGISPEQQKDLVENEGIPLKFIKAVLDKETRVELKAEDGDFWLVKTKNRKHQGLAVPSMYNIFMSLAIRRSLIEGDYATSDMMKHFIQHITTGESAPSGPFSGNTSTWAKKKELTSLYNAVSGVNRASRMVTNHTVKFDFIFPPSDMFKDTKYLKHEQNIISWSGISAILFRAEGGTYGSGHMGVRRTVAQATDARAMITWLITEFFDHPSIRERVQVPDDCEVISVFDHTVLMEPRQLLEELKFMLSEGLIDPPGAVTELNRSPSSIRRSKLESRLDNAATGAWEPVYSSKDKRQASAGSPKVEATNGGNAGRPANEDSVVDEESRDQAPTP